MLEKVYRTLGSMPDIVVYDMGCGVYSHLQRIGSDLIDSVGFPVDPFHFNCKHSGSNTTCEASCNPALFPELLDDDGVNWFFNTSVCEQTNVWVGGYHAILREMGVDRYDFFRDEMMRRQNIVTLAKLEKDGQAPSKIPGLFYTPDN
jgi:hypothetical protein